MATRRLKGTSADETRGAILDLIRSDGPVSRTELAVLSGLTEATISKVVKTLLDQNLVLESGYAGSTGGKRPVLLTLNVTSLYAIGVLLDATSISYVLTDLSGRAVYRMTAPGYAGTTPPLVIKRIAADIAKLLRRRKLTLDDVIGIGVAAAGRLDATGGALRRSRLAVEWEEFAIEASLADATGLPVILDNDANCAALGEFWAGRMPATHDFATVYMANGIGCGIIIRGDVYRGSSSNPGEIGHVTLDLNGPECFCGRRGCLEVLATPGATVAKARQDAELVADLSLGSAEDGVEVLRKDYAAIAAGAAEGDERCVALLTEAARYLGAAIVSMANLLDLDTVYLAGPGFAAASQLYLDVVQHELSTGAYLRTVHPVTVSLSSVGVDSAALGAAAVVLHSHLTPHHVSPRRTATSARIRGAVGA